ncbi:MAG: C4-dicarboxylate ABC transporter [Desulfobacteraceae bacterium 4484_190.1]|nr:MAG: C4-dicarboxylate ABC transporter [Desulfobacteraceae bacterium 4484_190.1]
MFDISPEILTIAMFIGLFVGIFLGHPLVFVLGGLAVIFGIIGWGPQCFPMFISRIFGTLMNNYVLIAIPLFIFMALLLDQTGISKGLFKTMQHLTGGLKGGLAVGVIIISAVMGASTGIIGASVVTMSLLSLPVMLKAGYEKEFSTGVISAGGTLGILIPPSIMLVFMSTQSDIPVGILFAAAMGPGLLLAGLYVLYVLILCFFKPEIGPPLSVEERSAVTKGELMVMFFKSFVPPMFLILGVLGSILIGIATPTEAAGVGALLTLVLVFGYGRFSWKSLYQAVLQCAKTTSMALMIVAGATGFVGVFMGIGGGDVVTEFLLTLGLGKWGTFVVMMAMVFLLGMFIDWLGILLIGFPIFLPIANQLGFNMLWFVIMVAIILQSSFLTPPFGYALFYLKGTAPPEVSMGDIYKGIIPFVFIIILGMIICILFPQIITWLPAKVGM